MIPAAPRSPHRPFDQRRLAAGTLAGGILLWLAMCIPWAGGRVYTSDDLGAFHLPLRQFYAQCLATGQAFDWCPQLYAGFYLTGEGQVGMYHPLHWLLYRWLDLTTAFDLELLASYPLMLAGMYLFLRRHIPNRAAAMYGAVAFTFCGFNTLHFVHPHAVAIVAHLPWLLACLNLAWHARDWRGPGSLSGIALLLASQILIGYPQYVWFSLFALAAYACFLGRRYPLGVAAAGRVGIALALGVLAGAVQWLPTWDWLADSQRQHVDAAFAVSGSLHPLNLIQLISPYLFQTRVAGGNTHELGLYIGAVPLMLVVWLLACPRCDRHSRFLKFAAALTLLAFVLALGSNGGLYWLQTWLPVVGKFRMPARYLVLVHFGLATLSAIALARLMATPTTAPPPRGALLKTIMASTLLAAIAPLLWGPELRSSLSWACVGPLLLAAAAGALMLCQRGVRGGYAILIALTILDLGAYGLSYAIFPNTVRWDDYLAAGDPPTLDRGYRVAVESPGATLRTGNHLLVRGLHQVDGYAGLEPQRRLDYRQTNALQLAGVQWTFDRDRDRWQEVPNPLPRVRLVSKAIASMHPAADLNQLDLRTAAFVEQPLHLIAGAGDAALVTEQPGRMECSVNVSSRQLLVVAESFHRGWRAEVDGRPTEVLRVNGDFLGCVVEPGQQRVSLKFQPASLIWGRRLSLIGIFGIIAGFVLLMRPMFEGRPGAAPFARADTKAVASTEICSV